MASSREIRQRIKSVKNIQHITKAMKMVAAARLRRAQERAAATKPFTEKIKSILANVMEFEKEAKHPLLTVRPVKNIGYYVVASDKGLAGAYNANVTKLAAQELRQPDTHLITVGRKAREYFARRHYTIEESFEGFSEKPGYNDAVAIARSMAENYISGKFDEIRVIYTEFYSPMRQKPVIERVLPAEPPKKHTVYRDEAAGQKVGYLFEPSPQEILEQLVPRYLETIIYTALIDAAASELGSRMTAMSAATDNSTDIISKLTLYYNKIRQAGITREISEIVAGAEALK